MADDESSRPPIASGRRTSENESAHDSGPFEEPDQIAAHVAKELRHSGVPCETVIAAPTQTAVLRRDRIVIVLAFTLLTALAWSYLLWLSADMAMGGMDMIGFRMIPSGMALMVPADPVAADRVRIRVCHVDCDDGRHDDAFGCANVSHVRPCGPAN